MIANTTAHFTISGVSVFCNCLDGIVLFQIENGLVQDSQISVPEVGMKVDTSNNFQITGNHIESGDSTVMSFYNSDNFDASYNILQGGAFAIKGSYVRDASIVGNTGGAEDGIALDNTSRLLISENSLVGHVSISVQSCGDLTIDSNTATAYEGIALSDCSNVLVSNNSASNIPNGQGIFVAESTSVQITSNSVSNDATGIGLDNSATGNSVTSNSITNNQCGIATGRNGLDQNYIADNTFQDNARDICNP